MNRSLYRSNVHSTQQCSHFQKVNDSTNSNRRKKKTPDEINQISVNKIYIKFLIKLINGNRGAFAGSLALLRSENRWVRNGFVLRF